MKTYELARAVTSICDHVAARDMDQLVSLIDQVRDASATPLRKSAEVLIWRPVRLGPRRGYADVFEWVRCDAEGRALTPTGRVMVGKHECYAWR